MLGVCPPVWNETNSLGGYYSLWVVLLLLALSAWSGAGGSEYFNFSDFSFAQLGCGFGDVSLWFKPVVFSTHQDVICRWSITVLTITDLPGEIRLPPPRPARPRCRRDAVSYQVGLKKNVDIFQQLISFKHISQFWPWFPPRVQCKTDILETWRFEEILVNYLYPLLAWCLPSWILPNYFSPLSAPWICA